MTRTKRGFVARKRRNKILNITKGFVGSHSKLFTTANQQSMKALKYAYINRRKKKNNFKSLWIKRISVAAENNMLTYNKIINKIKKRRILLNKKILSSLIIHDNKTFKKLIEN